MKKSLLIVILGLLSLVTIESCKESSAFSGNNAKEPEINAPVEHLEEMAVLYQQTAAEYRALCYQAFNLARYQLDNLTARHMSDKKMSVVVDIDETILDNSPYEAKAILEGFSYPEGWDQWVKSATATAVPGALDFVKYAKTKEVEVFYVTNRSEKHNKETLENLQKLGFPFAAGDHLFMKRDVSSKKARRAQIANNTEIILLIGDNLADFSEVFDKASIQQRNDMTDRFSDKFGSKFIVLPNPIYGDWLSAIYKYDNALTPEQKSTLRRELLKSY